MTRVAQTRGTARHKKLATAISQPKGLERNLRNELIASPVVEPASRRSGGRQGVCHITMDGMAGNGIPTRLLLLRAFQVDLGSFMPNRDCFESLASIGMAEPAKISCGPFVSNARS